MELAGALGDLGTILPIAIAMILINGLNPLGLFFSMGVFYIISGIYFGTIVPVEPMKVIGAYAVATSMSASQILASSLLVGLILLIIGLTGAIETIRKYTPKSVIRGVQLSTGALLISGGIKFMIGTSKFQALQKAAEPYLTIQFFRPHSDRNCNRCDRRHRLHCQPQGGPASGRRGPGRKQSVSGTHRL